jgi:hypothetical protein
MRVDKASLLDQLFRLAAWIEPSCGPWRAREKDLFDLGADLTSPERATSGRGGTRPAVRISEGKVRPDAALAPPRSFALPGKTAERIPGAASHCSMTSSTTAKANARYGADSPERSET